MVIFHEFLGGASTRHCSRYEYFMDLMGNFSTMPSTCIKRKLAATKKDLVRFRFIQVMPYFQYGLSMPKHQSHSHL
jgi:hypothetical protein